MNLKEAIQQARAEGKAFIPATWDEKAAYIPTATETFLFVPGMHLVRSMTVEEAMREDWELVDMDQFDHHMPSELVIHGNRYVHEREVKEFK